MNALTFRDRRLSVSIVSSYERCTSLPSSDAHETKLPAIASVLDCSHSTRVPTTDQERRKDYIFVGEERVDEGCTEHA